MGFSQLNVTNNKSGYKNSGAIKGLIQYIMTDKRTGEKVRFYGGTYVDYITSGKAERQIKSVKKQFRKLTGRQMYHYVLSFPSDVKDPREVYEIGYKVVHTFFDGFQTIFAVHENTDNLHIHIILNSVSFDTGRKWHLTFKEYFSLKSKIEQLADSHINKYTLLNFMS